MSEKLKLVDYEAKVDKSYHTLEDSEEKPIKSSINKKLKQYGQRTSGIVLKFLTNRLPIVNTLRTYQLRAWVLGDLMAGISIGIMHIPQGLGFASLAAVPAVYGIYSSFFPVLLYCLFGSSNHISLGTMALISILIGDIVRREVAEYEQSPSMNTTTLTELPDKLNLTSSNDVEKQNVAIQVATTVSLLVGIFQVCMAILQLGRLARYLSHSFISGFTTAAAFHIAISQIPAVLGIKIKCHSGPFNLIYKSLDIFSNITKTNVAEVITAVISAIFLISLKCINRLFKHKLKFPIPSELLLITIATMVSYFFSLHSNFGICVVGNIPPGFPMPVAPPMNHAMSYILDAFVIATVSFAISISLAKFFTEKYEYEIKPNQELFAYGISHIISSFFFSFAGATAPPRSLIHDSIGGKTQIAYFISSLFVLLVMLFMAPIFQSLPTSVLAALIIVALKDLFLQFQKLQNYWSANRFNFWIWVISWMAVLLMDIPLGLVIAIVCTFVVEFIQSWIIVFEICTWTI